MKKTKLPQQLAKNASKLHKHIGKLLVEIFPNYQVRQEYPVNKVNESFPSGREKFDWVVLDLKIVIEVHGQQHYKPTCFGGITKDRAKINFRQRLEADWKKQEAAEKAGWTYLIVRFDEQNITADELIKRISESVVSSKPAEDITPAKSKVRINNPKEYKWPTRKIQSRPFQKTPDKDMVSLLE